MRTKNRSFQLEKTLPGMFLAQGWLAGILSGFIFTVAGCFWHWNTSRRFTDALYITMFAAIGGSFLGVIKAILMWIPYGLIKFQPRPITRVAITSICTSIFAFLLALKFGYGLESPKDTAAWVVTLLLGGLPAAMLVGSGIKPWELFTFGSIAIGDSRTGGRVGSKSALATLGTLPLRFLSLSALAVWILFCACKYDPTQGVTGPVIIFFVPLMYLLFSAYVTFKSPHRVLLLVSCIVLNVPVGLVTYLTYTIRPGSFLFNEAFPYVCGIGSAFLIAWAIFLVARLTAPTQRIIRETRLPEVPGNGGHHCLGSRFMEWQEHHA